MPRYTVEVTRTISVSVPVEAGTAEDAVAKVNDRDFPLPARDAWEGHKDWRYFATNDTDSADTYEQDS